MNTFKQGDIVVANCNCGGCLLNDWLGTVEVNEQSYNCDDELVVEFTEIWYGDCDILYLDSAEQDSRMNVRHATEQEKLMYIAYGSRGLGGE